MANMWSRCFIKKVYNIPGLVHSMFRRSLNTDKSLTYTYRKPKIYERYEDGYIVRAMTIEDTRVVQNWYCGMGKTGPYDLRIAHAVYSNLFLIGELDGVIVCSAGSMAWGDKLLYSSLLYVDEKHRGSKIAERLLSVNLNIAAPMERTYHGDAVKELTEWYNKFLRMKNTSFCTVRYHGTAKLLDEKNYENEYVVKTAADVDFEKILEYDNKCFVVANCSKRKAFLQQWLNVVGGQAVVILDKSNFVVGFGQRRPCFQEKYHEIGPLYADNVGIARRILKELCKDIAEENVVINIWSQNKEAVKMMEDFQMEEVIVLPRMIGSHGAQEYEVVFKDTTFAVTSILVCGF